MCEKHRKAVSGGEIWKVVGGASTGGIIVRTGCALTSPVVAGGQRLATGALVRQLATEGDRLLYELLSGKGPSSGWVTLRAAGRELLVQATAGLDGPESEPDEGTENGGSAPAASRAAPGSPWYEVLGISPGASAEEVRRAFRTLALQHHPDKLPNGGDGGEAFRLVQRAYEVGLQRASCRVEAELQAVPLQEQWPLLPVPLSAPKAYMRDACDGFERMVDLGQSEIVPADIPLVAAEQVAEWLLEGRCVPIDTREPADKYGEMADTLPGSVSLGYTQLLKRPETAIPVLADLQRRAGGRGEGKGMHLVSYSTHGSPTSGNCAMVCCMLVGVFGFRLSLVSSLEDGYLMWRRWLAIHADEGARLRVMYGPS